MVEALRPNLSALLLPRCADAGDGMGTPARWPAPQLPFPSRKLTYPRRLVPSLTSPDLLPMFHLPRPGGAIKPILILPPVTSYPETPVPFIVPPPPWRGLLQVSPEDEVARADAGLQDEMAREVSQMAMEVCDVAASCVMRRLPKAPREAPLPSTMHRRAPL